MDDSTTIKELKDAIGEFCEARDWSQFHNPKDLAIHLSVEAGELLDHFRYKRGDDVQKVFEEKREKIEDELADVLILVMEFARMNDIDVATAYERKLKESGEKYPVEQVKGNNKKYNEY